MIVEEYVTFDGKDVQEVEAHRGILASTWGQRRSGHFKTEAGAYSQSGNDLH